MFDFPEPFGPTITLIPEVNSRVVLSPNDLKPRKESERRNTLGQNANRAVVAFWEIEEFRRTAARCRSSATDREVAIADGLFLHDVDVANPGPRWPVATPFDHRVHALGIAFEGCLHPSIAKVADEPSHSPRRCFLAAVPAEAHALHVSRDDDMNALGQFR